MDLNKLMNMIVDNFDIIYMLSVNILTYIIIKIHDYFNGNKQVPIIGKRIYLVLSILCLGTIYYQCSDVNIIVLINSSILAPLFWSWILKPIIKKAGIDYKHIDDTLK